MRVAQPLALAVLASVLAAPPATAQDKEDEQKISCASVPAPARAAFKSMFPKAVIKGCATEIEEGKTAYEFTSREGKVSRDVLFYADGSLIVVEETIDFAKIPQAVRDAVQKAYPRRAIRLSEKATRGATVYYEFQIRDRGKDVQLAFDPEGNEKKP